MAKRKKDPNKPDVNHIMKCWTDAAQYWGVLHANQWDDYTMFNLEQLVNVPEGYNIVRPSTAHSVVMTAADHIAGDTPQVEVPEAGLSKKAQERSESLEHGLQDALHRFQSAYPENPLRTLVINGLWSGQMISKGPIFDGDEWGLEPIESEYSDANEWQSDMDEYERTKRLSWPFYWRAEDPRFVYPDPGTVGKKWVIVRYQRSAGSIQQQWKSWDMRLEGMSPSDPPLKSGTLVDFIEYWDENYRAYMVGAASVDPKFPSSDPKGRMVDVVREHRYGKPPFQIRSAGYGLDSGLPHERFRSILYPARSLINAEIGAYSQRDALMRRTAWTQVLTPIGSGFDSVQPGTVKEMQIDHIEHTKPFSEINPQVIAALDSEIEQLSEAIQQATFPNVVSGIKAKGIASGYGQNSLVAQAKVKYGAAVVNLSSLIAEFLVDFGSCIQHVVQETVPVWGQTRWGKAASVLDPKEIDDLRYVIVTINPKLPTDDANDLAMAQIALQLGLVDTDTAITTYLHFNNPGEIRTKIMRDKALQSPEIQRVLSLAAAMEGGYVDYVMEQAKKIGMDPGQLLTTLGFGNPSQQAPAAQSFGGQPQNVAAQVGASQGLPPPAQSSTMGGNMKPQPVPGGPADIRNQAAPGTPIG